MIQLEILNFDNNLDSSLKENLNKAFNLILKSEGLNIVAEVTLEFVSDEKIKELNRDYRNIDRITDVLSFPIFLNVDDIKGIKTNDSLALGDIIININQAEKQAKEFGHSLEYEILYLAIHSFYHLLGYDHLEEDDKKEMREKEKKIIRDGKFYETR